MCQRWSTTDDEDYLAIKTQRVISVTVLHGREQLEVKQFKTISGMLHVVRDKYKIPPVTRALLCRIIASSYLGYIKMITKT